MNFVATTTSMTDLATTTPIPIQNSNSSHDLELNGDLIPNHGVIQTNTWPTLWPNCAASFVIKALKELKEEHRNGQKAFYSSYNNTWERLNQNQRNNTLGYFLKLKDTVKQAVATSAGAFAINEADNDVHTTSSTNKHDRTRLMHIFAEPRCQQDWADAYAPIQDRQILDDRDGVNDDGRGGAWGRLASAFNNYEDFVYQNVTIMYLASGQRKEPFQPRTEDMEGIAGRTWELDPSASTRPERNGDWIQSELRAMRKTITIIHEKFKKSGNQEAENLFTEWNNFCSNVPDIYVYAYVLLPNNLLNNLGKVKPIETNKDTGVLGARRTYSEEPAAVKKRVRRAARKLAMSNDGGESGGSGSKGSGSKGAVPGQMDQLGTFFKDQERFQALSFLQMNSKAATVRKNAEAALMSIAFPKGMPPSPTSLGTPNSTDDEVPPMMRSDYDFGDQSPIME